MRSNFSTAFTWLAGSLLAVWAQEEARAKDLEGQASQPPAQAELPMPDAANGAPAEPQSEQLAGQDAATEPPLELAQAPLAEELLSQPGEELERLAAGETDQQASSGQQSGGTSGSSSTASGSSVTASGSQGPATVQAAGGGFPLGLAALLPLAGGAGGGGGGAGPLVIAPIVAGGSVAQTNHLAGRAIDGYVKGATVFYDANGNGVRDAGEASAVTAADGSYTLDVLLTANGRMIMEAGGVDVLTGQRVGVMVAPAGYTGINPFTMLLASSPGLSEAQLKAVLGMDAGISLDAWDPIAEMESGDASRSANAQAAFIKAQQIFTVVQGASALAAQGAGSSAGLVDVSAVAAAVANAIANAGAGQGWNQILDAALDAALNAAMPSASDAAQQQLAGELKSALTQLLGTMESSMAGLAAALQSDDQSALAASMAAVAVAQDLLLNAAQAGNVSVLSSLADPDSLARLTQLYQAAITEAGGSATAPVQLPVLSLQQVSTNFPQGAWVLADSADNLAAKAIQQHGPGWFDSAVGVVVLDTATVQQAVLLVAFANLSFVSSELDASGAQSLDWDDYLALRAAGLHAQGETDLNLNLPASALAQAAAQASSLHGWGIRHLDVDGDEGSISEDAAAALLAAGIDFNGGDHIVLQTGGATLAMPLDDLHYLGVDQISGTAGAALHVSWRHGAGNALPAIDSGLDVTLHLAPGEMDAAVANASQMSSAGIDWLDNGGQADLADVDALGLANAGLAFVLADHVTVHAEGTVLQSSLSDLQHLAVDEVDAGSGSLHLQAGSAVFGASLPMLHPAANVVLHLQAAQVGSAIEHAHALHHAGVDQFDVSGSAVIELSDLQAASLAADGLSFAAGDMVAVHAGGTHLQNSLHDLQQLGVDEVHSEHGTVVLHAGGDFSALSELPVFDPALDVSLAVTPAEISRLLLTPHGLAASHIDHLRLSGTPGSSSTPPAASGHELDAALASSGADLVLEGDGPLALTDDQAARLLLAGRLQANDSVQLSIVHMPEPAPGGEPDELELSLAQLAQLGADHVEHVQGASLLVQAGLPGVNLEQELQQLLAQFPSAGALFGDAQVSLDVGAGNVNSLSDGLTAELKLLGIDHVVGEDGAGHALDRPLA